MKRLMTARSYIFLLILYYLTDGALATSRAKRAPSGRAARVLARVAVVRDAAATVAVHERTLLSKYFSNGGM